MAKVFQIYIRNNTNGNVLNSTVIDTPLGEHAREAFLSRLTTPPALESGESMSLILKLGEKIIAQHDYGQDAPSSDYWSEQLNKVWPKKRGRPSSMVAGKRRDVYLDDEAIATAEGIGNGNLSEGIRAALAHYRLHAPKNDKST